MKLFLTLLLLIPSLNLNASITKNSGIYKLTCEQSAEKKNFQSGAGSYENIIALNMEIDTNNFFLSFDEFVFLGGYKNDKPNPKTFKITSFNSNKIEAKEIQNGNLKILFTYDLNNNTFKIWQPGSTLILEECWELGSKKNNKKQNDTIFTEDEIIPAASGTGFYVNLDGFLITNNHVIEDCDENYVFYNGIQYKTNTVGVDKVNDLALLKSSVSPKKFLHLNREDASLLDNVIVAGYPLGKSVSSAIKTTKGSITSLAGFADNYSNFQTDAALNRGNSGGPIINEMGNVIGVAVSVYGKDEGIESFNFGIKSSVVRTFMKSLNINFTDGGSSKKTNSELSDIILNSTVYLECWMSYDKIQKLLESESSYKAFFSDFIK